MLLFLAFWLSKNPEKSIMVFIKISRSFDTVLTWKTGILAAGNQALPSQVLNYILKYIKIENSYLKL